MNKALSIQRSKLLSSSGGVGSSIDTIDNLSYMVRPFDEWNIYKLINNPHPGFDKDRLIVKEERLRARLKNLGFESLESFFLMDDFANDMVKVWAPEEGEIKRMVTSHYFPRWFYCPRCHRFMDIDDWERSWSLDTRWRDFNPACGKCSYKTPNGYHRTPIQQIRFVMASMETGEITDIPWNRIFSKKGKSDLPNANVWYIDNNTKSSSSIEFHMTKGSSDLYGIYVKNEFGIKVTMAELMSRYIVMLDDKGTEVVYRPVVRNANNVYFGYNISSVFIPRKEIPLSIIEKIKQFVELGINDVQKIQALGSISLSTEDIQSIIDSGFQPQEEIKYDSEEALRYDEFKFLTDTTNYDNDIYRNVEGRLISEIYRWDSAPSFIKGIYFQRKLNVTIAQVAYSRIEKINSSCIQNWGGQGDSPKQWFDTVSKCITKTVPVKMHPTCKSDIRNINTMPVISNYGEGFFIELDMSNFIANGIEERDLSIFLHTFCHLIMKELEFSCGYPLASLSERLYILPKTLTNSDENLYGFMIYSANGESSSYGGIANLFYSKNIEKVITQAIEIAKDCPNDPICEDDKGHCFACVDLPETSCEKFNTDLNRKVFYSLAH